MEPSSDAYASWPRERLVERIKALDARLLQLQSDVGRLVVTVWHGLQGADSVGRDHDIAANSNHSQPALEPAKVRLGRKIDRSKYSTRLIALKFAYLGQNYNGFEYHANNTTPLPTIEEVLWKALHKSHLVFPTPNTAIADGEPNWEGCEYSKCGRTDRGVSAFGQVVGLRVRSNRPRNKMESVESAEHKHVEGLKGRERDQNEGYSNTGPATTSAPPLEETIDFHPIHDEIPYCQVLNRLLPPDIKVLAWCPAPPPDFSARFSCKERRYEYFFTQPAFTPTTGSAGLTGLPHAKTHPRAREGWLDIEAMRTAAKKFEGLHDFRNFCKIDASKQIENFERRIFFADILPLRPEEYPASYMINPLFQQHEPTQPSPGSPTPPVEVGASTASPSPTLYVFRLNGSAFLWHQVRHMISILFLIGQGLEAPTLIDELLDVSHNPCKPHYEMADDAPLVLRDCIFPRKGEGVVDSAKDALEWVYVGDYVGQEQGGIKRNGTGGSKSGDGKYGTGGVVDDMWRLWRGKKIDEVLAGLLLNVVVNQEHRPSPHVGNSRTNDAVVSSHRGSQKIFLGGNSPKLAGKYVPVMQRPRMESVEVINRKFTKKKEAVGVEVGVEVEVEVGDGKVAKDTGSGSSRLRQAE